MLVPEIVDFLRAVDRDASGLLYLRSSDPAGEQELANGLNAHVTLRPADWWYGLVQGVRARTYRPALARADLMAGSCTLAFRRR